MHRLGLNYESSEHGREQDAQKATKSKSTAKSNYVELRGQIISSLFDFQFKSAFE